MSAIFIFSCWSCIAYFSMLLTNSSFRCISDYFIFPKIQFTSFYELNSERNGKKNSFCKNYFFEVLYVRMACKICFLISYTSINRIFGKSNPFKWIIGRKVLVNIISQAEEDATAIPTNHSILIWFIEIEIIWSNLLNITHSAHHFSFHFFSIACSRRSIFEHWNDRSCGIKEDFLLLLLNINQLLPLKVAKMQVICCSVIIKSCFSRIYIVLMNITYQLNKGQHAHAALC